MSKDNVCVKMKNYDRVGFIIFLIAGCFAVAGDYFAIPWLTNAALIVFGLIACVAGFLMIFRSEAREDRTRISSTTNLRQFSGISAYLMGGVILLTGILTVMVSVAGLFTKGGTDHVLTRFAESDPGIASILTLAGCVMIVFGLMRVLSQHGASTGTVSQLVELSVKAGGIISIFAGIGLVLLAFGFLFAPDLLRNLFGQLMDFGTRLIFKGLS